MASDIADFYVLVPLRSDMSEHAKLILNASHELNICIQYSLVKLAEFKVLDSEVRLVHIFHVGCSLGWVTSTEEVESVDHTHVKVDGLSLEEGFRWLAKV